MTVSENKPVPRRRPRALIGRYAGLLALPAAPYALYLASETIRRTDNPALHATLGGKFAVVGWALLTIVPYFALLGAVSAILALGVTRLGSTRRRWVVASALQGVMLTLVLTWAYVNQAMDYYTGETLTPGTLHFIWENPTEVFQTTWKLARWRLGGIGVGMVVALVGLPLAVHRWNRPWYRSPLKKGDPRPGVAASRVPLFQRTDVAGIAAPDHSGGSDQRGRVAGVLGVVLLTWFGAQFFGSPSAALVELSRTAPPLRFLDLTRRLMGDDLRVDLPEAAGPPIVSDDAYAASMIVDSRPSRNVILIVLESVPSRALSCYGYEREVSPHIDALADGGVVFENCIATASFSAYGQISVFTSLHMLRHAANDHFRTVDFPYLCLHSVCKLRGYELAAFSSANEGFENVNQFYTPGEFDTWFSRDTAPIPEDQHFDANRMDDRYATDAFVAWVAKRDRDRPFFCYINLQSTHFDYWIPEPWASHYQPTLNWLSSGNGIVRIPPEQLPKLRNQFDNALRYLDHCVGRIHGALRENGYLDDSVVVLIGDHGEAFMEHGVARHGFHLYQEVLAVPLIVSAPGFLTPQRRTGPVSQLDINPTVTGLLGLRPHPSWQGVDVLIDGYDGRSRPIFSVLQLSRMQEAVQVDGWKYIYDFSDCRDWLFRLEADPGETRNLARSEPAQREVMRELLATFHSHQLRYYGDRSRYTKHYIGALPRPELALTP